MQFYAMDRSTRPIKYFLPVSTASILR